MAEVTITPLTELADWIDTTTIAEAILEELEEQGVPVTLENCQKVWLDVLQNGLPDALCSSVKALLPIL